MADAVDLDRHVHELAGAEPAPGTVRAQRQGHALLRPAFHRDDLGPALAGDQQRVDLFEVGVDTVRGCDCLEEADAAAREELRGHDLCKVTSNAVTSTSETSHSGSLAAVPEPENTVTIEELAAETGMTVRN